LSVSCDSSVLYRRAEHSCRGVLPSVMCLSVIVTPRQWGGPGPLGLLCHWKEICRYFEIARDGRRFRWISFYQLHYSNVSGELEWTWKEAVMRCLTFCSRIFLVEVCKFWISGSRMIPDFSQLPTSLLPLLLI
jgi:hypothetical protein